MAPNNPIKKKRKVSPFRPAQYIKKLLVRRGSQESSAPVVRGGYGELHRHLDLL
jgi:hypothetical protein